MPVRREVKDLGRRWPHIIKRVAEYAKSIPDEGLSLTAFERGVLLDVDPSSVRGVVDALHARGTVWARRNRGAVRIFATRPREIAGVFHAPDRVDACLAGALPYLRCLTQSVRKRDDAKSSGDVVSAQEAREIMRVSCARIVDVVGRHTARGTPLKDIRDAMWDVFQHDGLEALASFETAFAREAKDASLIADDAHRRLPRIAAGLPLAGKISALIAKAGSEGMTKSALLQGVRPKPASVDLGIALDRLCLDRMVEARSVRVAGSGRVAVRYFALSEA